MNDTSRQENNQSARASHRVIMAALAFVALGLAWTWMWRISAQDPWYRNTDMNIHNLADALSLNSGFGPGVVDQPAAPTKFLLALDYRLRNAVGLLPTWTVKRFARASEPFHELAHLVQVGREHSRLLVILFILISAAFIGHITRRFDLACFTIVLLCGSSGLLFHGLLVRPELLCAAFGGVLALYCGWLATMTPRPAARVGWLTLAGLCAGIALLSKLPALLYLGLVSGWCCIAPLLPVPAGEAPPAPAPARGWATAICLVTGLATLVLLLKIAPLQNMINPVATARLRGAAVLVALLPLFALSGVRGRLIRYLIDRSTDLAVLLAGVLAAFAGWFVLLRTVLPAAAAADYTAKILNTTVYPDPLLKLFTLPGSSHRLQESLKFYLETPVLFSATTVLALALAFVRVAPLRWRALILLLLAQSLGMVFMMSKRLFLEQYSVFTQVPLLLIWALSLAALHDWWQTRGRPPAPRWPVALATTAAMALVLTVPVSLVPKYAHFQSDAEIPVRDFTITFLYDHDVHPPAYLAAMKQHYPTRAEFAAALNRFLSDPANRH